MAEFRSHRLAPGGTGVPGGAVRKMCSHSSAPSALWANVEGPLAGVAVGIATSATVIGVAEPALLTKPNCAAPAGLIWWKTSLVPLTPTGDEPAVNVTEVDVSVYGSTSGGSIGTDAKLAAAARSTRSAVSLARGKRTRGSPTGRFNVARTLVTRMVGANGSGGTSAHASGTRDVAPAPCALPRK